MTTTYESSLDERGVELAELLSSKGLKAKYHLPTCRVYLNGYGRDIKAYFSLDPDGSDWNPEEPLWGTALKVYSNCEQGRQWLANRRKQVKHAIMSELRDIGLIADICKDWRSVIL